MAILPKEMFPEITKIEIDQELDGFEYAIFQRLLPSFNSITEEAKQKAKNFKAQKAQNFHPDYDDEGIIEDDALSIETTHIELGERLRQNFLNQCAVELFHILEKRLKIVWGTAITSAVRDEVIKNKYEICICTSWTIINKHLRAAANTIKHGNNCSAAEDLKKLCPDLFINGNVIMTEKTLKKHLSAMRDFWDKALENRIIK